MFFKFPLVFVIFFCFCGCDGVECVCSKVGAAFAMMCKNKTELKIEASKVDESW